MKKLNIYLLIVAISAFSCKKVLDVSSYTSITDATAFETADRCLLSLNGVYDAAQSGPYAGGTERRGYPFGAANIEQGDARGEDVINIAAFYQITYQGTYNGTSANCVAMWDNAYGLINKANICIEGFKGASTNGILPAAAAIQYEAECRFLRAMAHHEVLIHWARPYLDGNGDKVGIPYRDFPINSGTKAEQLRTLPRMRVDSVYTNILADLDFAETNLPALQTGAAAGLSTYRATKAAAIALKMRIKLHKGDWAGVITEGNKLVPATAPYVSPVGGWTLTANPDGPFASNITKESVFSVKNDALDAPSVNGGLAYMLGATNLGGRGLVAVSPIIWNNPGWLCTDKRRSLLYVAGGNANGSQSYLTTKYRDYVNRSDYAPQIRYAEILLTLAEAEARSAAGVSTRAIELVNLVRNRALADPATEQYVAANFADKIALVRAILLERRIEFLFEGKRWADISRNALDVNFTTGGIPAKAVNGAAGLAIYGCGTPYTPGQGAFAYSDYRFLWPVPTDEVTQNPIVKQNPGY
jgi:starch-binding outer membrane protein, SusD/RagB family